MLLISECNSRLMSPITRKILKCKMYPQSPKPTQHPRPSIFSQKPQTPTLRLYIPSPKTPGPPQILEILGSSNSPFQDRLCHGASLSRPLRRRAGSRKLGIPKASGPKACDESRFEVLSALPIGHRPQTSSFLGLPYRILNMHPKKELLWGLWVGYRVRDALGG